MENSSELPLLYHQQTSDIIYQASTKETPWLKDVRNARKDSRSRICTTSGANGTALWTIARLCESTESSDDPQATCHFLPVPSSQVQERWVGSEAPSGTQQSRRALTSSGIGEAYVSPTLYKKSTSAILRKW